MRPGLRVLLVLMLVVAAIAIVLSRLSLDYRIDAFLPAPESASQAVVTDQLTSGPGGRLIFAAIEGAETGHLETASRALAERWQRLDGVERVDNGIPEPDRESLERLMRARFVLTPDIESRLAPEQLRQTLRQRLSELALAGGQAEEFIRRDPLGLVQEIGERLAGSRGPSAPGEIWLDTNGRRALLVVTSAHPPFDIQAQESLLERLTATFDALDEARGLQLQLAGAPVISVDSANRSRADARRLSSLGAGFLLLFLLWAWRSPLLVAAAGLPLAAGVLCGLLATAALFGQVHGLTLAFGFTLLGVALDYPVHLFGHAEGGIRGSLSRVRTPMLLGAASTLIAYAAIWLSSSPGLAQLGAFSAAGLAGATATTLLVLPRLGLHPAGGRLPAWRIPALSPWILVALLLLALAVMATRGTGLWSGDLTRLSPVDPELVAAEGDLRRTLDSGDARHLLVVTAGDRESVLQATERAAGHLAEARQAGLLANWQSVVELVPSARTQRRRLAQWPQPDAMREMLAAAGPAFRRDSFEPFLQDLEDLEDLPEDAPVTPESWQGTPLEHRVDSLLAPTASGWRSILIPAGLSDPDALAEWLDQRDSPARLVDLKRIAEGMVADYRREIGVSLSVAALLILGLLWLRLRRPGVVARVALPPATAVSCTAAVLALAGDGLTIVHLTGLLLVGGIGLDYALFVHTRTRGDSEARMTRQAVTICAVSTGGVFLILGSSEIGMLRMLGLTVACGVLLSFLFAWMTRPPHPRP